MNIKATSEKNISTPLVSIIIPVHNAALYLETCLQSVCQQTYSNIEIIIVNDGSTDHSLRLIKQYAQTDPRINYTSTPKQGSSLARKTGVEMAIGTYIQFIDSDDTFFAPDTIEKLVTIAQNKQAKIVASPYISVFPDNYEETSRLYFEQTTAINYLKEIFNGKAVWAVWAHFFARELFNQNSIVFPQLSLGEDAILTTQLVWNAQNIVASPSPGIRYYYHTHSMSTSHHITDEHYQDFCSYPKQVETFLTQKQILPLLEKEWAWTHINHTFGSIYYRRLENLHADLKQILSDIKKYPDLKKRLDKRKKKIIVLARYSTYIAIWKVKNYIKREKL